MATGADQSFAMNNFLIMPMTASDSDLVSSKDVNS